MQILKNPLALIVVLCLAILVAWQAPNFIAGTEIKTAPTLNTVTVSDLTVAGALSRVLAQYSPILTDSEKGAISQNYYGAPLESAPRTHTLVVTNLVCEQTTTGETGTNTCTVMYGDGSVVTIADQDAEDVYTALRLAGVLELGRDTNTQRITADSVQCTIDDAAVQGSGGNNILGFSCTIQTTHEVTQASTKVKRFEQCVFTNQGAEFFVSPCIINGLSGGLVTVGVSETDEAPANPFFYLTRGTTDAPSSASWNGGVATSMKADVPLPGAWEYKNNCFVGEGWTLCFPADVASVVE
jgi:hypothetical protein